MRLIPAADGQADDDSEWFVWKFGVSHPGLSAHARTKAVEVVELDDDCGGDSLGRDTSQVDSRALIASVESWTVMMRPDLNITNFRLEYESWSPRRERA